MTRNALSFRLASGPGRARRAGRRWRPRLELLEDRVVPSTFTEVEANDTAPTANAVIVPTGDVLVALNDDWINISGAITGVAGPDLDFFSFTLAGRSGVFFDIDSRETGLSATLDSIVTVFDAGSTQLGANDNGYDFDTGSPAPATTAGAGAVRDSSLYLDLAAGTYTVRVSTGGSTGNYLLRVLADPNYSAAVPVFNSLTGATDTLLLDFNGHSATDGWGTYTIAPYDFSGNGAEFTPGEKLAIKNTWRTIAEDYSPFALNVSTSYAGPFTDGAGFRQVIGNDNGSAVGVGGALGVAFLNSYAGGGTNTAFTFAINFSTFGDPISGQIVPKAIEMGNTSAHEFGHALGLRHYVNPSPTIGIMFTPDSGLSRETWFAGTTDIGSAQDDMAVISNGTNTIGLRPDDHGDTRPTATPLTPAGGVYTGAGIIRTLTDLDFFSFAVSGSTTIDVSVDDDVNDLDVELRLYDSGGNLLATHDPAASFDATLSQVLATGTYFIEVRSDGGPGEAGQYAVRVTTANTAPTVTSITNQTINEDTSTGALGFTINDAETPAASLTVTASSTNPTLLPIGSVVLGGSGANRTITITPAANQFGTANITIDVSDGTLTTSRTFMLTVNSVNDLPTISLISDQTIPANSSTGGIAFSISDVETTATQLGVSGSSSNLPLVPNANIVFAGVGANRSVSVTPTLNQAGMATITITVNDANGGSAVETFVLTVVNSPPTISNVADQTTNVNVGVGPLPFTIGDAETPAASLILIVGSSNQALVPNANIVIGGSGANRTVTVTPLLDQVGAATITLTVRDEVGVNVSDTFVLTVVNTPPTISDVVNQTTNEDTSVGPLAFLVGDAETPAASLILSAASSNPALIPVGNIVFGGAGANRTVTLIPLPNQSGTATITLIVNDGGLTATDTVVLTVNPVNDAPVVTFLGLPGGPVNEGTFLSLTGLVSDDDSSAWTFQWSTVASNGQVVPPSNTQQLAFVARENGNYTVTLIVTDNGSGPSPPLQSTNVLVIAVQNVAPTPDAGGPYAGTEGDRVTLAGSATDPAGVNDPLTLAWDLDGDGIFGEVGVAALRGTETGANPIFNTTGLAGTVQVRLRATDDEGGAGIDTADVLIIPSRWKFDFNGPGGVTEPGFIGVDGNDLFANGLGHGWQAPAAEFDNGGVNALLRDGHMGTDNTFRVRASPNTTYQVTLVFRDAPSHDRIDVFAEGLLRVDDLTIIGTTGTPDITGSNFGTVKKTFNILCADGTLDLRFVDDGGVDGSFIINSIQIVRKKTRGSRSLASSAAQLDQALSSSALGLPGSNQEAAVPGQKPAASEVAHGLLLQETRGKKEHARARSKEVLVVDALFAGVEGFAM